MKITQWEAKLILEWLEGYEHDEEKIEEDFEAEIQVLIKRLRDYAK